MRNTALRTDECWDKYQAHPHSETCFLCEPKPIRDFKYWYIMENDYPYDKVAVTHHMLVPKQHVQYEEKLPVEARHELIKIFWELDRKGEYDAILRNFVKAQSHTAHLHYHLLTFHRA